MEQPDLDGRRLALLLMGTADDGEPDWAIAGGIARANADGLYLDRGADKPIFEIRPEWIPHIREVEPENREMLLGADYVLPLAVGNLDSNADDPGFEPTGFGPTGLKWPK